MFKLSEQRIRKTHRMTHDRSHLFTKRNTVSPCSFKELSVGENHTNRWCSFQSTGRKLGDNHLAGIVSPTDKTTGHPSTDFDGSVAFRDFRYAPYAVVKMGDCRADFGGRLIDMGLPERV